MKIKSLILILIFISTTLLIESAVRIKQNRDINFGKLYPGESKTILIPNNCAAADADSNIGKTQFDHTNRSKNATVTVDWTTPATLDDGGGNSITFTNQEAWCDDSTTGTIQDITDWGSGNYNGLGTSNNLHNIYWGGSLSIPSNAVPGIYSGTVNITLSY